MPSFKSFEDSQEFFVMSVIVELCSLESAGEESDQMYFAVSKYDQQDRGEGIVGGIGFTDNLGVRNPMRENKSASNHLLESSKRFLTSVRENPWSILLSESGQ